KSRLSEFQKRSLLVVNEAFEILSNEELGQKAGFQRILIESIHKSNYLISSKPHAGCLLYRQVLLLYNLKSTFCD
ncbi:MAG: hypothetical protein AAF620_12165, partial [Bacteroidota bacterium]